VRLTVKVPGVATAVPPQVELSPLGVATTRPGGRKSVNATPTCGAMLLVFVIVKAREVLLLRRTDATPNCLAITGGARTKMVALAVLPVPPLVDVTVTELVFVPALVVVTLRETAQVLWAASDPPERLMVALPAVAVAVPPQDEARPLGVETTKPDGRLSVNATPVSVVEALGFVIVKVREVAPPTGMDVMPNILVIEGGDAMAGPAYPATMSVAASHIISAARFPAKRGVKHTSNLKRPDMCISTSCGIRGERGYSEH
jgi:hypothetical protein